MRLWQKIAIGVLGAVAVAGISISLADSHPYRHFNANIERVDEETDGLEVYHDHARGVTCYRSGAGLSCVADLYLTPHNGAP